MREFAARRLCERALASGLPAGLDRAALRDLASLAKRQRDFPRACALWEALVGQTSRSVSVLTAEDAEIAELNLF